MPTVRPKSSPTSCAAVTLRLSHGTCTTKSVAALLRKPPPMKSKPVNETMSWFAGLARIASSTCFTTLSVRSSDAPSGRNTAPM